MEKLTLYMKESYNELLKEVSWPTLQQLQESTVVVLATAIILATLIFVMDASFGTLLKAIYGV